MTPADRWQAVVDAIKQRIARAEAATEGPWDGGRWTVGGRHFTRGLWEWTTPPGKPIDNQADAIFIAAARTEHPAAHRALLEIAERHKPGGYRMGYCEYCMSGDECDPRLEWPCPDFLACERAVDLTPKETK